MIVRNPYPEVSTKAAGEASFLREDFRAGACVVRRSETAHDAAVN
ncbi:hypothetical protein ACWGHM_31380 [Streptomyces sp. NPDC054904]|nr:hypothetical protein [Streptomyces sp. Isolate_45]MDA5285485.1 hypothetical protein [Streptomyces sp. Isolate_45]